MNRIIAVTIPIDANADAYNPDLAHSNPETIVNQTPDNNTGKNAKNKHKA